MTLAGILPIPWSFSAKYWIFPAYPLRRSAEPLSSCINHTVIEPGPTLHSLTQTPLFRVFIRCFEHRHAGQRTILNSPSAACFLVGMSSLEPSLKLFGILPSRTCAGSAAAAKRRIARGTSGDACRCRTIEPGPPSGVTSLTVGLQPPRQRQ